MSRTIETEVYQYSELDDAAKEKACDWYRDASRDTSFWSEHILDEAPKLLAWCGFSIDTRRGTKHEPAIYWNGFYSQGDGACFEGSWAPVLLNVKALQEECPRTYKDAQGVEHVSKGNAELWAIAEESARLAALDPQRGIGWRCTNTGRGSAAYNTSFEHWDEREPEHCERGERAPESDEMECNGPCDCRCNCSQCELAPINDIEDAHESNARDAMQWIYRQLEREYEYQHSDEVVAESIEANEYEFTKEGKRV